MRLLLGGDRSIPNPATGAIGWRKAPSGTVNCLDFRPRGLDLLAVSGRYSEMRATACALVQEAVADAVPKKRIRHLSARIDASSLALAHALAECGFELIDGIQTFALPLEVPREGQSCLTGGVIRAPRHRGRCGRSRADIARSSFVYDRFHNDLAIGSDTADRVHAAWARNSVSGQAADAVLVCSSSDRESEEGAIDSFVTVKIDSENAVALGLRIATIPLVATAIEARGHGAARRATEAALDWCRLQRVDIVEVGTQISNIPAARLYEAAGFRTTAISLTYRKLVE